MAIEAKEIIEYLGFKPEDIKELSDLKPKMETEFIRTSNITEDSEPVKKIVGKIFGSIETDLNKVAKASEVSLDEIPEWKDAKLKDKLKIFAGKLEEKSQNIIADLTKKAGQNSDEKVRELEVKLEKQKIKISDLDSMLKNTAQEYNQFKEQSATQLKTVKINVLKSDALSKIKFKPDISEFEREGYNAVIEKKYKFDLDENDKPIVTDSKGSLIPNLKVNGTWKTIQEVLEEEAIAGKLYQLNNDAGKPKPSTSRTIAEIPEKGTIAVQPDRQVAKRMQIG